MLCFVTSLCGRRRAVIPSWRPGLWSPVCRVVADCCKGPLTGAIRAFTIYRGSSLRYPPLMVALIFIPSLKTRPRKRVFLADLLDRFWVLGFSVQRVLFWGFSEHATVFVIGKALVLDEIINYIQSLQQQVEFGQQAYDMAGLPFGSQPTREFSRGSSPEWLHMRIGGYLK
ncbi:hypothetical protein SSX86_028732 [Deinandra increscens subsp. villosa]|uniref:Uncharacterized protein n=1 Tax=Deinandra increscens subsp. villosa TaxID=3103831 RepID=A0AAP0CF00_9ASTR